MQINQINHKGSIPRSLNIGVVVLLVLYFGQSLLIPMSFGLLIGFLLYPICNWLEGFGINRGVAILISLLLFTVIIIGLSWLMIWQFSLFTKQWPALYEKIAALSVKTYNDLGEFFNIPPGERRNWLNTFLGKISQGLLTVLPKTIYDMSVSMILFFLIPIYAALILFYRKLLMAFLFSLFPGSSTHQEILKIVRESIIAYYNFIKGMALVYLVVAILNSLGLAIIGVPNAIFFGVVASILTFIPYIGITIGALLPISIAWLMFDSIWYPIAIIILFMVVQILEANVIFPLAVSFKLKINALATITVIIFGGIIWGASGMILFMPFAAILKLIADKAVVLKPLATLLGTNNDMAPDQSG